MVKALQMLINVTFIIAFSSIMLCFVSGNSVYAIYALCLILFVLILYYILGRYEGEHE